MIQFEPVIVDPYDYDKGRATKQALTQCFAFLERNNIPAPKKLFLEPQQQKYPWNGYGWCTRSGRIFVNVKRSLVPVKMPGWQWSFTGSKADLTAPGILAHEIGHWTKWCLEKRSPDVKAYLNASLVAVAQLEPKVTSYEPNLEEVWAEATRLFILNPDLLFQGRPRRYSLLRAVLEPVHDLPWRTVLKNANPKLISSIENWIEKGNKS